jgi:hypothetical protein
MVLHFEEEKYNFMLSLYFNNMRHKNGATTRKFPSALRLKAKNEHLEMINIFTRYV